MSIRYLFNTRGKYVAFVSGDNVFTKDGEWIGSIGNGNELWDRQGKFIGYIFDDDRVIRNRSELPRLSSLPKLPPLPPLPPLPALSRLPKLPLPPPYEDVFDNA
ncbi:MAG: hypothetical protein LGR52_15300 [Candidatus Thiosymbion ectosymbiont of Robbea hypermnestra]|nr:hypothetical protein [Candidatus Thiosymbion ectosymbiont of Robbea hypermnestra]